MVSAGIIYNLAEIRDCHCLEYSYLLTRTGDSHCFLLRLRKASCLLKRGRGASEGTLEKVPECCCKCCTGVGLTTFCSVPWRCVANFKNDCGIKFWKLSAGTETYIKSVKICCCFDNLRLCDSVCDGAIELGGSCDLNAGARVGRCLADMDSDLREPA